MGWHALVRVGMRLSRHNMATSEDLRGHATPQKHAQRLSLAPADGQIFSLKLGQPFR
jgi:hypothetical protein